MSLLNELFNIIYKRIFKLGNKNIKKIKIENSPSQSITKLT